MRVLSCERDRGIAIHDILRRLVRREFPSGRHRDAHGHVRLVERVMSWEGYVRLAFGRDSAFKPTGSPTDSDRGPVIGVLMIMAGADLLFLSHEHFGAVFRRRA
jgi:hypothetical protein